MAERGGRGERIDGQDAEQTGPEWPGNTRGTNARAMGRGMAGFPQMRSALLLSTVIALAACQPGQNPFARQGDGAGSGTTAAPAARSVKLVDRDVEAPEVFQVTEQALWDGRPSLGGVWVASPDATDPERVILRNPANGKFVIGALFKREAFNPGPKLQISSDAADALGLLAGQPGTLSVTALRREEVPAETDANRPLLDANEPVAATATATVAPATPARTGSAAPGSVSVATIAATAIDKAEAAQPAAPVISGTATAATTTNTAPAAAPTTPPASGGITVQIGIFSQESNANRAVETLQKAGLSATSRKETTQGKTWWSVTATGGGGREALLTKVRGLGFTDAYVIRR